MPSFHARSGAGELLARYSFIEPLLQGRRVLELGAAGVTGGASALFLVERGAAQVLSVEADEASLAAAMAAGQQPAPRVPGGRARVAARGRLRPGAAGRRRVHRRRAGAGGGAAAAPRAGRAARHRRRRRRGGAGRPGGRTARGGAAGYEAFVGALAAEFPQVEVATQSATVGWVFGIQADGEPDVALDGSLRGDARDRRLRGGLRGGALRAPRLHAGGAPRRAAPGPRRRLLAGGAPGGAGGAAGPRRGARRPRARAGGAGRGAPRARRAPRRAGRRAGRRGGGHASPRPHRGRRGGRPGRGRPGPRGGRGRRTRAGRRPGRAGGRPRRARADSGPPSRTCAAAGPAPRPS